MMSDQKPEKNAAEAVICPYCNHRFSPGGIAGYLYCPACGKRFNPHSVMEETVMMSPAMATEVLIPSPAEADTTEIPMVPVDEESEARRFGDYDILSEIARGGMGVVYRARHRILKRIVALKVLRAGDGASQEDINRFMQEAKAVASLSHPNIVPIHELNVEKGQYYFTMNYIDGWSLDQIIERQKLSPYRACEIIETIARAIHYAHTKGIIHRDIKPANVIMSEDNRPMITDFGLAVNLSTNHDEIRMTRDGSVMGTIPYIPPEQAAGRLEAIGPRSDVYSLGALLYEMLTGRPPFTGMTQYELLQRVINQYPPSPRKINHRINVDLDTICMKCMAKEPERRYQTALALAEDCRAFLNGDVIKARPTTLLYRVNRLAKRYPAQTSLLAVVALLGTALLMIANFAKNTQKELTIKEDEHLQTVEEKKKLDERVERQWREDFGLHLDAPKSMTNDMATARNRQICWLNPRIVKQQKRKLQISAPAGENEVALGIPVNLPNRYRIDSRLIVVDDAPGNSSLEFLLGLDRNFHPDAQNTISVVIGTRGNPGARLLLNNTVLSENNTFFLENNQEYNIEITQGGSGDVENADGDMYPLRSLSLLVDGTEILSSVLLPAVDWRSETFLGIAGHGLRVELSRFDINIPGLSREMIKSLLEVGNSLSDRPDERSLARLLYKRVLRERIPTSVILQVYLGFAKTTLSRNASKENLRMEYERLTANLRQSRGERIFPGEIEYGYGVMLAMGNKPKEAEPYFQAAYNKARDAARRRLTPATVVGVGPFRAPLTLPTLAAAQETFTTINGEAAWKNLKMVDSNGGVLFPATDNVKPGDLNYVKLVYGPCTERVNVTFPPGVRVWSDGTPLPAKQKNSRGNFVTPVDFNKNVNCLLCELPAGTRPQKYSVAAEIDSWKNVNVFGLLARIDEVLAALSRSDYPTTIQRMEKLRTDGVVEILREQYSSELQVRAVFTGIWQKIDDMLLSVGKKRPNLLLRENTLAIALRILDTIASIDIADSLREKELAKRYCAAAEIYVSAATTERRDAEKRTLLYNAERLLNKAREIAQHWFLPACRQAEFYYGQSVTRNQTDVMFRAIAKEFPDSIEVRQEIANFYMRKDLRDYLTGRAIGAAPGKALPVIVEALNLSDRKNPQVLELYAEALLALGNADEAWKANAEARAIDETPSLREQHERIRSRRLADETQNVNHK